MNRTSIASAVAAFALAAGSSLSFAQTAGAPPSTGSAASSPGASSGGGRKGPVVSVQSVSMTGRVTAIDRAKRQVTVKDGKGHVASVLVGEDVRNFDNLKVGDEVTMHYTQAQSLAIAKGGTDNDAKVGEIRTRIESSSAGQAAPGGKPGVRAMEQTVTVANVFAIDRENGIVTLRGTSGDPVEVKVPDKALKQLKLNDQVVIGYRQAMAVSIAPGSRGKTSSADARERTGSAGSSAAGASPGTSRAAAASKADDDRVIRNLMAAAQRLRDSILAMAQAPAGDQRTDAVRRGNEALLEVQRAMADLPSSLLLAKTNESDYQKAMGGAKQAAQRLRDAAQNLAGEPAGPRRNEAIRQINEALLQTQQYMADIAVAG